MCPTDKPINIRYRAGLNHDPVDSLWMTGEKSGEQGHAYENISHRRPPSSCSPDHFPRGEVGTSNSKKLNA
ncbi:hypothetical protein BDV34DRAFT_206170 [Aspergillus parasiticus]|uniref:Uncharacterized protein n=1 Tax=Aspergillus parasiticus TaxID=5067 RepID=A0A5N6D678_ASPPA|nr:hypothetical protein BDV34DRAFT_206170 [Aspergillus parasiticus]